MIKSDWFKINEGLKIRRLGDKIIVSTRNVEYHEDIENIERFCQICEVLLKIEDVECEFEDLYLSKR